MKAPDVDTVVAYVYNDSDPEYWENFLYFLQWGMGEGDGCKYLIVLSSSTNAEVNPSIFAAVLHIRFLA